MTIDRVLFGAWVNLIPRVFFVPLDKRWENESSGSNPDFSGRAPWRQTALWNRSRMGRIRLFQNGCSQSRSQRTKLWERDWLLPELSFSDRWSRGTKTLLTRLNLITFDKRLRVIRLTVAGWGWGVAPSDHKTKTWWPKMINNWWSRTKNTKFQTSYLAS